MEALKEKIRREGKYLGNGILKVDNFLNHQVDPALMLAIGGALAAHFGAMGVTKVLTAEISGIAPALMTALALGVPVVYGRKTKPITMPDNMYLATAPSHTKGVTVNLMVSPEFMSRDDTVIIVDDFLATGHTIAALVSLAEQAEATVVGVGCVIEKAFEGGRQKLEAKGLRVRSLAIIQSMSDDGIVFAEGVSP